MSAESDAALKALREALALSPENLPLRLHVATLMLGSGLADEAEDCLRLGLAIEPRHPGMRLALARAFQQQGKRSQALVVLEDLVKEPGATGAALVLYARLLLATGEPALAARHYRRGVELHFVRAATKGTFTLPPASGELMYEPASDGWSDGGHVTVE